MKKQQVLLGKNCDCSTDNIEDQVKVQNLKVRITPEVHAKTGAVIGFTLATHAMTVIPDLIGADVSCDISGYNLGKIKDKNKVLSVLPLIKQAICVDVSIVQNVNNIIAEFEKKYSDFVADLEKVCFEINDLDKLNYHKRSIGSCCSVNHFIELGFDKDEQLWLFIHCDSRNLGHKIASYWHNLAFETLSQELNDKINIERKQIIKKLKTNTNQREVLAKKLSDLKTSNKIDKDSAHLYSDDTLKYLEHVNIAQRFSESNHRFITEKKN